MAVVVLAWPLGAQASDVPCTWFAAPILGDGGRVPAGEPYAKRGAAGTMDAPMAVSDFWKRDLAKPGSVLCLKDGLYRGKHSMLTPTDAADGTAGAVIEVRAVDDGDVWIDGEFQRATLRISNSYWTVSGLNVYNSVGPPVGVKGIKQIDEQDMVPVHHIVLRRIVAWRDFLPYGSLADYEAIGGHNVHVFDIAHATDVLVEDCAGFGWARKIFQNYKTHRVTFRRSWGRWDGRYPYTKGNKFVFSCSYKGYDAVCENLIATVGGSSDEAAAPASYLPAVHLIATDGAALATDRWLEPADRDVHALNLKILGSLALTPPGLRFPRVTGFHIGGSGYPNKGQKGVRIEDAVAAMGASERPGFSLQNCNDDEAKHPDGCSWNRKADGGMAPVIARRITVVTEADTALKIGSDWVQIDVLERAPDEAIDIYAGTAGGAKLCLRTVDGQESSEPLWPWPMQDRIAAATERSNWESADVMAEVTALFGSQPPRCSR